jgi:hypothetical protein
LITNVAHGLEVDEDNRFMLKAWRGNMRTIWSDADPSPRAGLGFGKERDDAAYDAVQAMRDSAAADSQGIKATSAALDSAKKLQEHADSAVSVLDSVQPLGDITPDFISREHANNATTPRTRIAMLAHNLSLTQKTVREVEDAMLKGPVSDNVPQSSTNTNAGNTRHAPQAHDEPTNPAVYGAFAYITEAAYQTESLQWVDGGKVGLPPLNCQQREAARPSVDYFIALKKWMLAAHSQRDLHLKPTTPQPKAPLTFIHAEPGAGKSVLVEVLCAWLDEFSNGIMRAMCCSYTGSAASLVPRGRTINNLFGFSVEEAGSNKNLHQLQNRKTVKKTATLNELTAMFDLMSDQPWHAVCVINDEVSQTTITLLGHIEQRMTQVASALTQGVVFGGHAMILVGDFFQKTPPGNASIFTSMVDRYIRLADDQAGTVKKRNRWRECYEYDTPMARGSEVFRSFTMVKLGAQMRSQSDADHISMIRNFRDITSENPHPLTPDYLKTLLPYSKADATGDISWDTAPIAVVGNVERFALSANRIRVFAKRTQQPVLKWKKEIKNVVANELLMGMDQAELDTLYDNEESLWQYFVAGAIGSLLENLCVARGLANGTRVVFSSVGYYDKSKHERVLVDIQSAIQRHDKEVILPGPPDYIIVEVTLKNGQNTRLRDISELIANNGSANTARTSSSVHQDPTTDKVCIAYRRENGTPKTSEKTVTLGSRFAHRRGLVKVRRIFLNE